MSLSFKNRFPMPGVEVWKNPKNKFVVFQLHYSADQKKREANYRDAIKSAMPVKQYMQEYELCWDSFEGLPVYSDFNRSVHGSKETIEPVIGLPLIRGWDWGLTPCVVVSQYVEGQLRIIKEITSFNKSATVFVPEALRELKTLYPRWHDQSKNFIDYTDPAGFQRAQTDEGTCAQVLRDHGCIPHPGPVLWEVRRKGVESFLVGLQKGAPKFLIDLAGCPTLVRGFEGGYRYPEKAADVEPAKLRPIKDEHSHPHDALQYVCHAVTSFKPPRHSNIPSPTYSWSKQPETRGLP